MEVAVVEAVNCPECQTPRSDPTIVCPTCGAPPIREGGARGTEEEVRSADLEPYITLRYIARLFKVLAALMVIMLIGEIYLTITAEGAFSLADLIGRITQLLVLAGLMWGGGDLTLLVIDAGHDLRVARILLGRINAELHRTGLSHPNPNPERAPRVEGSMEPSRNSSRERTQEAKS